MADETHLMKLKLNHQKEENLVNNENDDELLESLRNIDERLNKLEKKVESIVNKFEKKFDEQQAMLNKLNSYIEYMDSRLKKIEETLGINSSPQVVQIQFVPQFVQQEFVPQFVQQEFVPQFVQQDITSPLNKIANAAEFFKKKGKQNKPFFRFFF